MQTELIYRLKMYRKKFITNSVVILFIIKLYILIILLSGNLEYNLAWKIILFLIITDILGVIMIHYAFQRRINKVLSEYSS